MQILLETVLIKSDHYDLDHNVNPPSHHTHTDLTKYPPIQQATCLIPQFKLKCAESDNRKNITEAYCINILLKIHKKST